MSSMLGCVPLICFLNVADMTQFYPCWYIEYVKHAPGAFSSIFSRGLDLELEPTTLLFISPLSASVSSPILILASISLYRGLMFESVAAIKKDGFQHKLNY